MRLCFSTRSTWYVRQALLLFLAAAALLLAFEHTHLDLRLAQLFYDPEHGVFPLRRVWWMESLLHSGMKVVSALGVMAALFFCYQGYRGELPGLPRRNALLAALGMLLIPLGTTLLKSLFSRHCPWDVVDFGGFAPYVSLLDAAPKGIKAGQCFPAGHASTGFLWIVWGIALRPAGRRVAFAALAFGLLFGGVLGLARMAQGAHFLSHTLWSLWFAWALSVLLARLLDAELAWPEKAGGV
jgi:membrane-associated PAP2 superfamily phosphatase